MYLKLYKRSMVTTLLLVSFLVSVSSLLNKQETFIHSGGLKALKEILLAMMTPELSSELLKIALRASLQTLAYAVAGMTFAFILGFLLSIPASEIFSKKKSTNNWARILLTCMRGIHEIIWAWFFLATIGINPFTAILAITIPYAGTLGKIYADILRDCPKRPIISLVQNGTTSFQQFMYGYLPQTKKQLMSYTFYRLECAIRSSAILSFIGLGGLGYQINISLQDLKYNEAWTFIYFLVILVVAVDWLGSYSRMSNSKSRHYGTTIIAFMTFIFSWTYLVIIEKLTLTTFFNSKNAEYGLKFIKGLLGIGEREPFYMSLIEWKKLSILGIETFQMSVIAIGLATLAMIMTVSYSNKHYLSGSFKIIKTPIYLLIHGIYVFTRTVPELIWAVMLIFIFKPGILPGAIALALHNFGILGKLCSEVIEDYDYKPNSALENNGASSFQTLIYGTIPNVYNRVISYVLYRFEVIIRSSIVVGFIGAGGLGQDFRLSMSYFHYSKVLMILIVYLLIIFIADMMSTNIQKFIAYN